MADMFSRFRPSLLITAVAVILLFVALAALRNAPADITAAVLLLLTMFAGLGIGASVDVHPPPRRRH